MCSVALFYFVVGVASNMPLSLTLFDVNLFYGILLVRFVRFEGSR